MKNEQELVFFDLETTGLDATVDQIIEIGAVKVHNGKEVGRFERFCRLSDGVRLPEFITALTGISPLDLETAEPVAQVVDEFLQFAGTSPLLAHNSGFDRSFLRRALGFDPPNPIFDTLELARVFFPDLQSHSLVALVDALEIKKEESHRALGDSLSLFRFYRRLREKIAQGTLPLAVRQRLLFLFPAAGVLGLIGDTDEPERDGGDSSSLPSTIEDPQLPRLKTLSLQFAGGDPTPEVRSLNAGDGVVLQCDAASLRRRYLSDVTALHRPAVIILRSPSAVESLMDDASGSGGLPTWVSQESPGNLVCHVLLQHASQSATLRTAFGFELAALTVYEWETGSAFIPAMPLFLKRSRLIHHLSASGCSTTESCPFRHLCSMAVLRARSREATFHVVDLSEVPAVLSSLAAVESPLVSSPETEKLIGDVFETPELQSSALILRVAAGIAGEHGEVPVLLTIQKLSTRAAQLLDELFLESAPQGAPGVRSRSPLDNRLRSSLRFQELHSVACGLVAAYQEGVSALPEAVRLLYLQESRTLVSIIEQSEDPLRAVWLERQGRDVLLAGSAVHFSDRIRHVHAGATLFLAGTSICPGGDERFVLDSLGLEGSTAPRVLIEPSEQKRPVPTFVTLHLPRPTESGFEKAAARLIAETLGRFKGKAVVASNSLETLRRMSSFLTREAGLEEYSLLLPKNGRTRAELLQSFADQSRAILLVPFDYLSFGDVVSAKFLFITKLQFPNSFLPAIARLKELLKEQGADPFRQFDLPYALTLLEYTIRQSDPAQLRAVFMLDNRSFNSAYAELVRAVLPSPALFLPIESQDRLMQHVERWLRSQTL